MKENNRLTVDDVREISSLISTEVEQLKKANLSMNDTIKKMENRVKDKKSRKDKVDQMDIEVLDCSRKVCQHNDERISELSKLYKKITSVYLMMIKKEGY